MAIKLGSELLPTNSAEAKLLGWNVEPVPWIRDPAPDLTLCSKTVDGQKVMLRLAFACDSEELQ